MIYTKNISLDFSSETSPLTVSAKQQDSESRFLLITPKLNNTKISMKGLSAVFCAEKPDGKNIINKCSITSDDNILLELTSQTLALNGAVRCEIKLYEGNAVISSCPFFINVIESVSDDGFESSDEYTMLTKLINECKELLKDANIDIEKDYLSSYEVNQILSETNTYTEVTE